MQSEISTLMREKSDKEGIIKALTQENLRLSNQIQSYDQEQKISTIVEQEFAYLQSQIASYEK